MTGSDMTEPLESYDEDVIVADLEDPATKYAGMTRKASSTPSPKKVVAPIPEEADEEYVPPSFIGSKLMWFGLVWLVLVAVVVVVAVRATNRDDPDPLPAPMTLVPMVPSAIDVSEAPAAPSVATTDPAAAPTIEEAPTADIAPTADEAPTVEEAPTAETTAPVAETEAPTAETTAPVAETEAPTATATTTAPVEVPIEETMSPTAMATEAATTTAPVEAPIEETMSPTAAATVAETTTAPVEAPVEETMSPTVAATEAQTTETPVAETDAPTVATTGAPTEAPVAAATEPPVDTAIPEEPTAGGSMPAVTLLDILPDYSLAAIENPTSPQAFALLFVNYDPNVADRTTEQLVQRFALATLYFALGRDWTQGSVLPSRPECEWFASTGSVCNDQGQQETLMLQMNNLEDGPIPPEVGLLTYLKVVDMSDNFIVGDIPTYFGQLQMLESLKLSRNTRMMGTVPTELASIPTLEELDLSGLEFVTGTIPEGLCDVSSLSFDCSPTLCGCSDCTCAAK